MSVYPLFARLGSLLLIGILAVLPEVLATPHHGVATTFDWTQTDWSDGPGRDNWDEANQGGYDTASGVDGLIEGQLSLGYTLSHATENDLNQDGYADLVFANWLDQYPPQRHSVESYVYWGGSDGYSIERRLGLPTHGAVGVSVADLNNDGSLDLIFSNQRGGLYESPTYDISSYIYWGGESGYSPSHVTGLPTLGSMSNAIADLNEDGYLDIVFSNSTDGITVEVDSYIYWGGPAGYSTARRTGLPTRRGVGVTAVDLDQNGYLDLVFSNTTDGAFSEIDSYIYWGNPEGYSEQQRSELPTIGSYDNAAGDLNGDGHVDLIFSNRYRSQYGVCCDFNVPSYIYWGSVNGYDSGNRSELPTVGAVGVSVADLDADGYLDIVCSNGSDSYSHIYWGSHGATYGPEEWTKLPVGQNLANSVADLNRDGHLDLIFSGDWNGFVLWGDGSREFTTQQHTAVITVTSLGNAVAGASLATAGSSMGSVYTRPVSDGVSFEESLRAPRIYADEGSLVSSTYDAGITSRWLTLAWQAEVPDGTAIGLDLATSTDGNVWSIWSRAAHIDLSGQGTVSIEDTVSISRFIRYRVMLMASPDHRRTPLLEAIMLGYEHMVSTPTPSSTLAPTPTATSAWQMYLPMSSKTG